MNGPSSWWLKNHLKLLYLLTFYERTNACKEWEELLLVFNHCPYTMTGSHITQWINTKRGPKRRLSNLVISAMMGSLRHVQCACIKTRRDPSSALKPSFSSFDVLKPLKKLSHWLINGSGSPQSSYLGKVDLVEPRASSFHNECVVLVDLTRTTAGWNCLVILL